jgi:peptidoglycan/LPS O-acetylase OafA/YrhL
VLAVMLYHSDWLRLPGGYLGVEVFFVISGYLITSLLLAQWLDRGRIDLKEFWLRRARRLLPALFVVIASALVFAVLFLPDEVTGLRGDAVAALGYVTNWHLIFSHQSYFEAMGRPSLLRHLWSLAVEEQFYLLFPLLLLILLRTWRWRGAFLVIVIGAAASAAWMAALYQPDVDPSRVYYGTDTRASGLLIGAALAFLWSPWQIRVGRLSARVLDLGGLAALVGLGIAFFRLDEYEPLLYQGGMLLVALATALAIAATVHPRGWLGPRLLGLGVLRWVGTRSYSLYLWHWLVFDLTRPQLDVSLQGAPLIALRFILSGVLAELSYRAVETPFRYGAIGRAWNALRQARGADRRRLGLQWAAAGGAIAVFSIALSASMVNAQAPTPPADYLETTSVAQVVADTPTFQIVAAAPTARATPTPSPSIPATRTPAPSASPTTSPSSTPTPAAGATPVTLIGDSVALGAAGELKRAIRNIQVDAAVSRQTSQAIAILQARRAAGQLGAVVVVHLGNNGPFSARQFGQMMQVLAGVRRVVVLTVKVPRPYEEVNNTVLAQEAKQYPNVALVDWHTIGAEHPEFFWKDGIHLRPAGAREYADLIAAAVNAP